jgi:hypothetical protein
VTDTEIAWAAGLFDGEGSVTIKKRGGATIQLGMTDLPLVERFTRVVGVGSISGPRIQPNRKPSWVWFACGLNAVSVARLLLPYVGDRNIGRFERLIQYYDACKNGVCETCGVTFSRVHRDRRYCSTSCQCKGYRRRGKRKRPALSR